MNIEVRLKFTYEASLKKVLKQWHNFSAEHTEYGSKIVVFSGGAKGSKELIFYCNEKIVVEFYRIIVKFKDTNHSNPYPGVMGTKHFITEVDLQDNLNNGTVTVWISPKTAESDNTGLVMFYHNDEWNIHKHGGYVKSYKKLKYAVDKLVELA